MGSMIIYGFRSCSEMSFLCMLVSHWHLVIIYSPKVSSEFIQCCSRLRGDNYWASFGVLLQYQMTHRTAIQTASSACVMSSDVYVGQDLPLIL